jgi:hypothetical protein
VPAEMLEQLRAGHHDGPHTLPPLSTAASHSDTANDPHFGSVWASSQFRLLWVAVGLALAAALLAWLVPRAAVDRPAASKVTSTVKVAPAATPSDTAPRAVAATPAPAAVSPPAAPAQPAPQAAVAPAAQAAVPPMGARGAVARARPVEPRPLAPRPAVVPPPAARVAVPARDVRDDESARRIEEAARRVDAEAARRPTPVQAPCTAQVAALGLCDSKQ